MRTARPFTFGLTVGAGAAAAGSGPVDAESGGGREADGLAVDLGPQPPVRIPAARTAAVTAQHNEPRAANESARKTSRWSRARKADSTRASEPMAREGTPWMGTRKTLTKNALTQKIWALSVA